MFRKRLLTGLVLLLLLLVPAISPRGAGRPPCADCPSGPVGTPVPYYVDPTWTPSPTDQAYDPTPGS